MSQKKTRFGRPAAEWEMYFHQARIVADKLDSAKSTRAKTTILGAFLAQNVDREVPIEVEGRTGKAKLRLEKSRANQKRYYLEVTWDEPVPGERTPKSGGSLRDQGDGPPAAKGGRKRHGKTPKKKRKPRKPNPSTFGKNNEGVPSAKAPPAKRKRPPKEGAKRDAPKPEGAEKKTGDVGPGNEEAW